MFFSDIISAFVRGNQSVSSDVEHKM